MSLAAATALGRAERSSAESVRAAHPVAVAAVGPVVRAAHPVAVAAVGPVVAVGLAAVHSC